jgi:hypothetical protein
MLCAVVVSIALAPELEKKAEAYHEWEEYTRMRHLQDGDLRKSYPLNDEARAECEEWKKRRISRIFWRFFGLVLSYIWQSNIPDLTSAKLHRGLWCVNAPCAFTENEFGVQDSLLNRCFRIVYN